eukprot:NODE_306_length_10184_cov_0.912246.p7 type:complete len:280 gc:universal NODE_306_length_10184_cov_0.912246:5195-6034(+)
MSYRSISKKSDNSVRRPPKSVIKIDSKAEQTINGVYFIHSLKKLKDFKNHQNINGIYSNIIYEDYSFKMNHYGYYNLYTFLQIEDSSLYEFAVSAGILQIHRGYNFEIGNVIARGNSCKVTLDPGIYILHVAYKHESDIESDFSDEYVTFSKTPDVCLKYSSIGIAWPLKVRNIEEQIIPKGKTSLPINSYFSPVRNDSRLLNVNVDLQSVSSVSSRSPLRRPVRPTKRKESDPAEIRDLLEYKEHLERQVQYYSSVTITNSGDKAYLKTNDRNTRFTL